MDNKRALELLKDCKVTSNYVNYSTAVSEELEHMTYMVELKEAFDFVLNILEEVEEKNV